MMRRTSSPDPLDLEAQLVQLGDDALPLVALNLDAPVLDGAAGPAPLLERASEFPQAALVQGEVEYRGHALAPPPCRLPSDLRSKGLLGRLGGCRTCWCAFGGLILLPCA